MQLSTRSRYGLRALVDISLNETDGPVLLRDIAARQNLSRSYTEQLLLALQSAGFVHGIRGKKGGFTLAKAPSEIRLIDVVTVLEGTFCLVDCVDDPEACPRIKGCPTQLLWRRLTTVLRDELAQLTLQDLAGQKEISS